jgi:hypothetical protein
MQQAMPLSWGARVGAIALAIAPVNRSEELSAAEGGQKLSAQALLRLKRNNKQRHRD